MEKVRCLEPTCKTDVPANTAVCQTHREALPDPLRYRLDGPKRSRPFPPSLNLLAAVVRFFESEEYKNREKLPVAVQQRLDLLKLQRDNETSQLRPKLSHFTNILFSLGSLMVLAFIWNVPLDQLIAIVRGPLGSGIGLAAIVAGGMIVYFAEEANSSNWGRILMGLGGLIASINLAA